MWIGSRHATCLFLEREQNCDYGETIRPNQTESEMYPVDSLRKPMQDIFEQNSLNLSDLEPAGRRDNVSYTKVQVKPVTLKNQLHYQFAFFSYNNKVLHENLTPAEAAERMTLLCEETFRQGLLCTTEAD